jgi:hypothetical protein
MELTVIQTVLNMHDELKTSVKSDQDINEIATDLNDSNETAHWHQNINLKKLNKYPLRCHVNM